MQADGKAKKPVVMRVVTAEYVVPWHMANTLRRMPADFETWVIGDDVSRHKESYPDIHWVDVALQRKISPFADLRALLQLYRTFRAVRPDVVHSIMPKAGLLSAIAGFISGVPIRMHTFTGQIWATRQGWSRRFYYLIDRAINALNTLCMTDSRSQSAFLFEHGIRYRKGLLPVLSQGSLSGIDTARFHRDISAGRSTRQRLGIPPQATVFLYLGRLTRDKGLVELVQAFDALADKTAHLILAGPDEEGMLSRLYSPQLQSRQRIHATGFIQQPAEFFSAADVFCLPSHREGFGSVVIEAAACGVPAIGTRIPGLVDAIEHGATGLLFPLGDVQELRASMEFLATHPVERQRMGAAAQRRVEEAFHADVLYACLRSTYLELIRQNGSTTHLMKGSGR